MPRRTNGQKPLPKRHPLPLPPKRAPRPALKPQPRTMNKQFRGGR
jgi:hypothetical protein